MKQPPFTVPPEVSRVTERLEKAGFEAYLIGGCVRDLFIGIKPKDWDITTNASPDQILALFEHAFYENEFGTVGVVNDGATDPTLETVEVTTYRKESGYSNARHPDSVSFSSRLEDDLKRRDFTVNAIAYSVSHETVTDLFDGQKDLQEGMVRAVGDPNERFGEDALRLLRAVRIATEHGFSISHETAEAIRKNASLLAKIARERIRDELIRIVSCENPRQGIIVAHDLGLLSFILPDLEKGIGMDQNQAHSYDVWDHNLRTMQHAADKGWGIDVRLAGLLHDIGKPDTRRWKKDSAKKKGGDWTFYGHDVVGSRIAQRVLAGLAFPKKMVEDISKLVRWHMFFSDPEKITLSAVRRMTRNVGKEHMEDLMNLRICDRIGTGRPKEQPYRFRKYKAMIEEALRDPLSVTMLALNGNDLMKQFHMKPGPRIGFILHALLEEVLDDPKKNTREHLLKRAEELSCLPEDALKKLGEKGRGKKGEIEKEEVKRIRGKYWVE